MKKRKPFSADTIFWTIVAAAAVCALLFFLFGPKERWVSKSYSVDLGAAEEPVLVADFSRNAVWRGMPDGMWVMLDEQSGGDGAPVTFQLVRTEGRGAAETVEEVALSPGEEATFQLPHRPRFKYKLYAQSGGGAASIACRVSINNYEVMS